MIVVDAGLLIALTLRTAETESARAAFLLDHDWAAPPLWRSDFRGALSRRIRSGEITRGQAAQAFDAARAVIADNEPEPETAAVLNLALHLGLDMYDAEFVAVARDLGVRLVTSDPDLAAAVPDHVVTAAVFLESAVQPIT